MPELDLDLSGQVIDGRYGVEYCIGQGGMGIVWRVRHTQTRQLLALKTLRNSSTRDRRLMRRFVHEARAAAAIRSRNVVRVVDVNPNYVHRGVELPFLIMELLEGKTLAEYLETAGALSPAQIVWLMRSVSHGLFLAHERGIVHRDLKPSNIFLCRDEDEVVTVKLCDFGIARLVGPALTDLADTDALSTEAGTLLGTPRYIAPEQLRRSGCEGPATDQWALGLIAFRALAKRSYFAGNLADLIMAIVHDPLPRPSDLSALLPKEFDDWFYRSCARDPGERFPSVRVQQEELEMALGSPVVSPIDVAQLGPVRSYSSGARAHGIFLRNQTNADNRRRTVIVVLSILLALCFCIAVWGSIGLTHMFVTVLTIRPTPAAPLLSEAPVRQSKSAEAAPESPRDASRTVAPNLARVQTASPANEQPKPSPASGNRRRLKYVTPKVAGLAPQGAPCTRSDECEHGYCAAEVCQ